VVFKAWLKRLRGRQNHQTIAERHRSVTDFNFDLHRVGADEILVRRIAGIFRAGQLPLAATSVTNICVRIVPLAGFSRRLGSATGPGTALQSGFGFKKFTTATDVPLLTLSSFGVSADAVELCNPTIAAAKRSALAVIRFIVQLSGHGVSSTN
jgi:hypothetical protein